MPTKALSVNRHHMLSLQQLTDILTKHQNLQGGFVKHRLLGLSSSFAFCRSKMGPENFQQVPRWYWCYRSGHHPLRTSALKLDALYPPWRSRKEFISHLDLSHGLLVELWQLPHIAVSRTKCIGWFPSASPEAPPTIPHPALCPGRLLSVQPANGSSHLRRPEKMGYSFLWFWVSLWPVATLPGSSLHTTSLSGFFQPSSASPGLGELKAIYFNHQGPWYKSQIQCVAHGISLGLRMLNGNFIHTRNIRMYRYTRINMHKCTYVHRNIQTYRYIHLHRCMFLNAAKSDWPENLGVPGPGPLHGVCMDVSAGPTCHSKS